MAIIALKAWYIQQYEPIAELEKRPQDLRLSKNSLLKSGLRADFLEESQDVKRSAWFGRYLEGETVEFYIEGSGGYTIANVDLISHEIYFTKQEVIAQLEPIIFFSYQNEYSASSESLHAALLEILKKINQKSRIPITLKASQQPLDAPLRLSSTMLRQIRKSLLFVADGTPIASIGDTRSAHASERESTRLIPSPKTCVEIGYAMQSKRSEQILLARMERPDLSGNFPFDLPSHQQLCFKTAGELEKTLPPVVESFLQRFNLFS
jgi:hypothetical protein